MNEQRMRVRANRSAGELELEGSVDNVKEWWNRLWPEIGARNDSAPTAVVSVGIDPGSESVALFGEFYSQFRSDISDIDKVLVAAVFVQTKDADRCFTTKSANQLLVDQNIKVSNASESVRRLMQTKRVFVVSSGRFRVSTIGLEYLNNLRIQQ